MSSISSTNDVRLKSVLGVDWLGVLYPHPISWILSLGLVFFNAIWLLSSSTLKLDVSAYLSSYSIIGILAAILAALVKPKLSSNNFYKCIVGGLGLMFLYMNLRIFNHLWFSIHMPWADDVLITWSNALGLDWESYTKSILALPALAASMKLCYLRVEVPMAMLFLSFCGLNNHRANSGFVLSVALTAVVCTVISAFFPARSAAETLASADLMRSLAGSASYQIDFILKLQNASSHTLHPDVLPGLSTFPSFHTAIGVLLIVWSWQTTKIISLACSLYGLLMIGATPIYGGHYLIDLVAGALVAIFCALIAYPILDKFSFGITPPAASTMHG